MAQNRGLKNRKAISTAIDIKILEEVKAYSDKTKIPMSKILDMALEMYLESTKK